MACSQDLMVLTVEEQFLHFDSEFQNTCPPPLLPCGTLPFCDNTSNRNCYNTKIQSCQQCSMAKGGVFLFLIILLALGILLGNILVLCVNRRRHKKGTINKVDISKSSLAIADLLTGLLLLIFVPYNFSWIIGHTVEGLVEEIQTLRKSALANFGAVYYLFGYTSSVFHLIYIGLQRLHAVWRPINYKVQSNFVVYIHLAVIWIVSLVAATTPTWFPEKMTASLSTPLLFYTPVVGEIENGITAPIAVVGIVFLLVPYAILTFVTVCGGVSIYTKLRKSKELTAPADAAKRKNEKGERRIYVTLVVMQVGMTVTQIPIALVVLLLYAAKEVNCTTLTIPFVTTFYLSMTNSFINVIIYNVREKKFRALLKELFLPFYSYLSSLTTSATQESTV